MAPGMKLKLVAPARRHLQREKGEGSSAMHADEVDAHGALALDPQLSPDGQLVAFVRAGDLFCVHIGEGETPSEEKQLTWGGHPPEVTHGLAEYVAQEEMDRCSGFWWSRDSTKIAFTKVDLSHIPSMRIMHQGRATTGPSAQEDHLYPFAGKSNGKVRLGVVALVTGQITWMDLSCGGNAHGKDEYLARVDWLPDSRHVLVQTQDRLQQVLQYWKFDVNTGSKALVLEDQSRVWTNLHDCLKPLAHAKYGGGFLTASERTGFRHLYLHAADGRQLAQLTAGDWMVETVEAVDEERGIVYLTGTYAGPLECHLYSVRLPADLQGYNPAENPPVQLTSAPGHHAVVLDPTMSKFVDSHDSVTEPPTVQLRSLKDGSVITKLYEKSPPDLRIERFSLVPPEIITIPAPDGASLFGAVYRPDTAKFGLGPYKTVVHVYGGPHVQTVSNSWMLTVDMRAQFLRSQGYLVLKLDNRGSARRGLDFEGAVKHNLGSLEVSDQVAGISLLVSQGLTDPARVGIYGWSYGGYISAMSLVKAAHVFKAGVAGAPVTSWDGYDTHYTERYMGTPQTNPGGYAESSVLNHVDNLQGHLMIVHGLVDENVHFRHSARLINALHHARKEYELLVFPNERHMPRVLQDRLYMEQRIFSFFERHL